MKHFFSLLAFSLLAALPALAQNATLPMASSSLNVRDFGAKGDGKTDDTKAIQAAANAAMEQSKKWPTEVRHWNHLKKGIADNPHPEIVFPAGTYKISSTIVFQRYASLRGVGLATIRQSDSAKDTFYFHGLLRSAVENLRFDGGKIQLRFWTANNGTARVNVQRCIFVDAASSAIECRSYTEKRLTGAEWNLSKPWAPYDVQWVNGMPQLNANNAENLTSWANSTAVVVAHCRFENAMHALDIGGDTTVVRDCEVVTNPQMEGAVFNLNGMAHLYRVRGRARLDAKKHQYWIETGGYVFYTNLSLRDCDFDTDAPQGMALVRAALLPVSAAIVVENSRVKSAGSRENAIVWIAKETQPNIIAINNVTETSGQTVKAVAWEQTPDAATLEKIKDQPKNARSDYIYKLQIGDNANIDSSVPEIFAPLVVEPVPAAALQETIVPELSWEYHDLEEQAVTVGVLQASDFGVDQNPQTDDSAAVQKAFDAAAKQPGSLLVFPAGVLTISQTIQLPPNVVVRGAGVTAFVGEDKAKDIFSADTAQTIAFKNCDFNGGRNGLNLRSNATAKARLAFDNCSFYDQQENGISALAGKGETSEANATELRLDGGIFATIRAITTNVAHSQMTGFWAINDPRLNDDAFFKNRGGAMRVQSMLGNPTLWQGERGKPPADIKDWQLSRNTRWFDNWGKLYSLDNRFGGESGGMSNVFNRSENGTIYIGGGLTRFYNGVTRNCILYLEKTPRVAVLRDISSVPSKMNGISSVMNADGSDGRSTPGVFVRTVPAP